MHVLQVYPSVEAGIASFDVAPTLPMVCCFCHHQAVVRHEGTSAFFGHYNADIRGKLADDAADEVWLHGSLLVDHCIVVL